MDNFELLKVIVPIILLVLIVFFMAFAIFWFAFVKYQRSSENKNNINIDNSFEKNEADLGGYIVVDVPEERKSLFQDLLKGFEEYSLIKGYRVSISTDSSIENKIAFKFTIIEYGVTTSPRQVKKDLNEYIDRIQRGDSFDDLINPSDPIETQQIIIALRNRIFFLQQNYQVEKNIKEFHEDFVRRMSLNSISHLPPTVQINQGTIGMEHKTYSANNSANVMQGDNHSNMLETGNITIGTTYNEKSIIIEKLDKLLLLLDDNDSNLAKAKRKIESIKDELQEEREPDKNSIFKWLTKAKEILDAANVAEKIYSHAKDVYDVFGIQS